MSDFPEERSSERRGNVYQFPETTSLLPDSLPETSAAGIPESPPPVHPARWNDHLKEVVALLQNDLKRDWTVESLAEETGVCPRRLQQLFEEQVGISPMQYLKRRRLQRACHLLLTTRDTVRKIAEQVGYHKFTRVKKGIKAGFRQKDCRAGWLSQKQSSFPGRLSSVVQPDAVAVPGKGSVISRQASACGLR